MRRERRTFVMTMLRSASEMVIYFVCLLALMLLHDSCALCSSAVLFLSRSPVSWRLQGQAEVVGSLVEGSKKDHKLEVEEMFKSLVLNEEFKSDYWQKQPFLCETELENLKFAYTMKDVEEAVNTEFFEAGRGTVDNDTGGWNLAEISAPRGSSFEEAKLQFRDVEMALKKTSGTVVVNSAGGFIPAMAKICMETINAFEFPAAVNIYLTNPNQEVSAPPHTDKQDVFVLQTQGYKHWRVFAPTDPSMTSNKDPFTRGKAKDGLKVEDLASPLVDSVLCPGQVLYVPGGYPHTTDTVTGKCLQSEHPSVHLTIGIDTHIWGLNYESLRKYALQKAGIKDTLRVQKLSTEIFFNLHYALPLGFLRRGLSDIDLQVKAKKNMCAKMRECEPKMWAKFEDDDSLADNVGFNSAFQYLTAHHEEITMTMWQMYKDVAFKKSSSRMDVSFFRSQPYFQRLEALMVGLKEWAAGPAFGSAKKKKYKKEYSKRIAKREESEGIKSRGFG